MADRILIPLDVRATFFFIPPGKESRIATAYTYQPDGLKRVNTPVLKYPTPQGGLFSTALDMLRFHQMRLNKRTLDGRRVLSAAAVEAMTTSQTSQMEHWGFATGVCHGFGFEVVREVSGTFCGNSIGSYVKGDVYRTYGWVDPAKDLAGILMMQRTNGGGDTAELSCSQERFGSPSRSCEQKFNRRPCGTPMCRPAVARVRVLMQPRP